MSLCERVSRAWADVWFEELAFHLLRKHAAAEGNTALKGYGGKIRALATLRVGPRAHRRNHACQGRAQEVQKAKVSANRLDASAVFRAFRTELQELHDAREVLAGSSPGDASDIPHLRRQSLLRGRCNKRATVPHEKLQQRDNRANENESGHHRGTIARREGARRNSRRRR